MGIKHADLRQIPPYLSEYLAVFYSLKVVCLFWIVWENVEQLASILPPFTVDSKNRELNFSLELRNRIKWFWRGYPQGNVSVNEGFC